MASIKDLLMSLERPTIEEKKIELVNNVETWRRIGNKDTFPEFGLSSSELDELIKEFVENNEYTTL